MNSRNSLAMSRIATLKALPSNNKNLEDITMRVIPAVKNQYFNYFKIEGQTATYRIFKQVWNAKGISMQIQGPSWDGNGINGFGRRHLLTTEGSEIEKAYIKGRRILDKRQGGQGSDQRAATLSGMVNSALKIDQARMKSPDYRNKISRRKDRIKSGLERGYAVGAYGPNTDICTFVLLDAMTVDEVSQIFAEHILMYDWTNSDHHDVDIAFPDVKVVDYRIDGSSSFHLGINVSVRKHQGVYHLYHFNRSIG